MKKFIIIALIFAFSLVFRIWNLNAMGRTWDEVYYVTLGYNYIELARHGDFTNFYWIKEPDNPIISKYIYGIFAHFGDFKGYDKNHQPVFHYDLTYSRFASALLTSFAIVFVLLVTWEFFSPFVAVAASILLSMNPTLLAISQIAGIDSPRFFFAAALLYTSLKFLNNPSNKKIYFLGTCLGLSLITRFSDLIFIPMVGSVFIFWNWLYKNKNKEWIRWKYFVWFIIGLLQFVAIWPQPWLHLDYMLKIEKSTRFMYINSPWEWFFGFPVHVPFIYFAVHFLIRTPFVILLIGTSGLIYALKKRSWINIILLFWFIIPFIQSFYPYRQHGIRYLIEVYIPFYILAAVMIDMIIEKFTKDLRLKSITLTILVIYSFAILVKIKPYYFDYFNVLVGGPKNVYNNNLFELGWWGEGGREAGEYILNHAKKGTKIGYLLNPFSALLISDKFNYSKFNNKEQYEFVVENFYFYQKVGYNSVDAEQAYYILRKNYKLVYTVYADGAELYHIYKAK